METFDATPNPEVSEHAQETPRTPGQNWDHFSQVMRDYSILNHIPYKASFELTARCSLKCKMCLMRLDPEQLPEYGRELTAAEWIRLGEMAFNAGTLDLLLTGGEPMLRPDFAEIYTALSDMGFLLRVFTNATLVTDKIVALFEDRPPQDVQISMYGASRETYGRIADWPGGYDRMVEGVDRIRAVVPSVRLKTTIIRDNAADWEGMRDFARERNIPFSTVSLPMPAIRGAKADVRSCRLNLQELLDFHHRHYFNMENEGCAPSPEERAPLYCEAGLASYAVLWYGAMVACMTDSDPDCVKGHPLEEGFDAAWQRLVQFREGKTLPEECKTCPCYAECSTCAIHHRAESGSYCKRTRYACDFYHIRQGLPLVSH